MMRNRFVIVLAALIAVAIIAFSAYKLRPTGPLIFVFAGQSNMAGYGRIADIESDVPVETENAFLWSHKDSTIVPYAPIKGKMFGPELGFYKTVKDRVGKRPVYIIKTTWGNTDLHTHWQPRSGPMYTFLQKTTTKAFEEIKAENPDSKDLKITAFFWMQGEADAKGGETLDHAKNYQSNLTDFIQTIRRDYESDFPVIIGRINQSLSQAIPGQGGNFDGTPFVRQAQDNVGTEMTKTVTINTDDITTRRDLIHFNSEGQLELGRRFAQAWLDKGYKD